MLSNPVIETLMQRKSVRRYTERVPSADVIETIVRTGQQAPFAAQMGSVLLSRERSRNPFGAPVLFTLCADVHRLEKLIARKGWKRVTSDPAILLFAVQDAAYMAENMVIAAESLGLGSCFLGGAAFRAAAIAEEYALPPRVFPLVQLVMGYPADEAPPRPRYPLSFTLFEGRYPAFDDRTIDEAARVMDEGYLAQDYYRDFRVPLDGGREETCEAYSWTEHMGRKWGQWLRDPAEILEPLASCGFRSDGAPETDFA